MVFRKGILKTDNSQMGKIKFNQKLKAGSKQAGFGVPFITYHP